MTTLFYLATKAEPVSEKIVVFKKETEMTNI